MRNRLVLMGTLLSVFAYGGVKLAAQDLGSEFDGGTGATSSTPSASSNTSGSPLGSALVLNGDHKAAYHQPLWGNNWSFSNEALAPEFDNTLGLKYTTGKIKIVASGTVETLAGPNTWTTMSVFKPGESYISWTPGNFLLNFGYQIYNWGVADKSNPSDGLNAHDYALGWDAPKIPLLSANVRWFPNKNFSIEGVVAPYQTPSEFPVDFQAQTQAGLSEQAGQLSASPLSSFFTNWNPTATTAQPDNNPNSLVAGARLNYYSSGADLSLSYIYDLDPFYTPVVTMTSEPVAANPLYAGSPATSFWVPGQVELVRDRIHRFGANFKTTVGPLGLWLETGFDLTQNPLDNSDQVRRNRLAWTAGTDFSWGPNDNFYTNLQYLGAWIPGYDQTTLSDYTAPLTPTQLSSQSYMQTMTYRQLTQTLGDYTETFLQGLSWKLQFPMAESTVTPSLIGIVTVPFGYDTTQETRYASLAIKPEIDLVPADSFHLRLGADLAWAWVKKTGQSAVTLDTSVDRLGIYTPDNDVYINVEYQWNTQ